MRIRLALLLVSALNLLAQPADQLWQLRLEGNNTIAFPVHPSLDLGSTYSFALWVYPERRTDFTRLLTKPLANRSADPFTGLVLSLDPSGRPSYSQSTGVFGSNRSITAPTALPLNAWTHLAVSSNGTTIIFYVNGAEVGRTPSPGPVPVNNLPLSLSGEMNAASVECCMMAGFMRQFSVWNRALSPGEVKAGMSTFFTGLENGLTGFWPLDDGQGYTFRDLSPQHLSASFRHRVTTADLNGLTPLTRQALPAWLRSPVWSATPFAWSPQPQLTKQIGEAERLIAIDFDSDGDLDLVSAGYYQSNGPEPTLKAYRNDGQGHFTEVTAQVFGSNPPKVRTAVRGIVADLNHDGRSDLILGDFGSDFLVFDGAQNRIFVQTADGRLVDETTTRLPPILATAHDGDGADIDGDGNIDLVFTGNYLPNLFGIFKNDGAGHFSLDNTRLPASAAGLHPLVTRFFDANGDGKQDLFLGMSDDSNTATDQVLLNDGTGRFRPMTSGAMPPRLGGPNCATVNVGIGDLNGDGKPDIISSHECARYTEGGLQVLINRGDGTFRDETAQWLPESLILPSPIFADAFLWYRTIQFADFNADGRADIVIQTLDGHHTLYLNNGTRLIAAPEFLPNMAAASPAGGGGDLLVGDFNRDGRPDLVIIDTNTAAVPDTLYVGLNQLDPNRHDPLVPAALIPPAPEVLRLNIVNEASQSVDALAPGTRIRIRASGLGPAVPVVFMEAPGTAAPTSLGGVTVTFDSSPAQLLSVSATEIVAIVPFAVAGQWVSSVRVAYAGVTSQPVPVPITNSNPQVYADRTADGSVIARAWKIVNGTRTRVTASGQITWGNRVAFRITGAGQATAALADGAAPTERPFSAAFPFTVSLGHSGFNPLNAPILSMVWAPEGLTGVVEVVVDLPAAQPPNFGTSFFVGNSRFTSTPDIRWPLAGPGGAGGPCTYALTPATLTFPGSGGSQSVSVTTSPACLWSSVLAQIWTTFPSASSGAGNGSVLISVPANPAASGRSGALTIAGQLVPVSQGAQASAAPRIFPGGVVPVYSTATTVQPGSWLSIFGSNLAPATAVWNGDFPASLGGVTVTINGKPAYL